MQNMLLTEGVWTDGTPTFTMVGLTSDCPFLEAIFEPTKKVLILLTKEKEDTFQMLPRLDANGDPEFKKQSPKEENPGNPYKSQRVQMNTYHESVIRPRVDIELFVSTMAINADLERINKFF